MFGRCLERGLAAEGRLVKFYAEVSDRPGGIHELCEILTTLGVSIKDIMHERAWLKDIYTVQVRKGERANLASFTVQIIEILGESGLRDT